MLAVCSVFTRVIRLGQMLPLLIGAGTASWDMLIDYVQYFMINVDIRLGREI